MATTARINWHDVWVELRGVLIGLLVAVGIREQFRLPALFWGYGPGPWTALGVWTIVVAPLLGGAASRLVSRTLWPVVLTAVAYAAILSWPWWANGVGYGYFWWALGLPFVGALVTQWLVSTRGGGRVPLPISGWLARGLQAVAGTSLVLSPFLTGYLFHLDARGWVGLIVRVVFVAACLAIPSRWQKPVVRVFFAGLVFWWATERMPTAWIWWATERMPTIWTLPALKAYLNGTVLFALASEARTAKERWAVGAACVMPVALAAALHLVS